MSCIRTARLPSSAHGRFISGLSIPLRHSTGRTPELRFAPSARPPFAVEAVVVEDHTYLVLGADPEFRLSTEDPIRVHTAARYAQPAALGSVVVRSEQPLRLSAVVHDLSRTPTWSEEWVREAVAETLRQAESRQVSTLALPILGSRHGSMTTAVFLGFLKEMIAEVKPEFLRRIWIQED